MAKKDENIEKSENIELIENKIKNLTYIVLIGFIIIIVLLVGLYFKDGSSKSNTSDTNVSEEVDPNYDTSKMNKLTGDEAAALFDEKGTHVVFIGRSTCGVCVNMLPIMEQVQEELGYKTVYVDFDLDNFQTDLKKLAGKLDYETTVKTTIDGEAVTLNDTVGNLLLDYGFTPTIAIIKDGKMVNGWIGYKSYDTALEVIKQYMD